MLATKVEGWAARYVRKGVKTGKAEGRVEGKVELLERQLARRFGAPLPDWVRPHLLQADVAQLDDWAEQIFDAPSLESLFGRS